MTPGDPNETLEPRLDILPAEQRALWNELKPLRSMGFVLYGGTALALRLGHRLSIDFDFFSNAPLNKQHLWDVLPSLQDGILLQDEPQAITSLARATAPTRTVKLSLFGGSLKALVFFEDGDLGSLSVNVREQLQTAVQRLGPLPPLPAVLPQLT